METVYRASSIYCQQSTARELVNMRQLRHGKCVLVLAAALLVYIPNMAAQTCFAGDDVEPATLSVLQSTAANYFQDAQAGNAVALQPVAEFNLGDLVSANKNLLAGKPSLRQVFLLDSTASQPGQQSSRAEFFCGIYNSPDRVEFAFDNLPPGRYGVVIQDVAGGKTPAMVTWILHQNGAQWKIAGLYIRPTQIGGHDSAWYVNQARAYKAKGQTHNAWFYYLIANDLMRPFPAMGVPQVERLYTEMQSVKPADLPWGNTVDFAAAGRIFRLTEVFAAPVGDTLNLVVKYQASDISDSSRTFQDNMTLIKAFVAKYPEFREAFSGVAARAVAPNGQDYGSLLAMKDVK